jgi:hypothetical protein
MIAWIKRLFRKPSPNPWTPEQAKALEGVIEVFEDAIKMAENGMRFNAREAAAFEDLIKEMDGDDYIEPNWTRTPYIAEKQKPCDNQAEQ